MKQEPQTPEGWRVGDTLENIETRAQDVLVGFSGVDSYDKAGYMEADTGMALKYSPLWERREKWRKVNDEADELAAKIRKLPKVKRAKLKRIANNK